MKRRSYLTAMLAGLAGMKTVEAQKANNPIVLYCDLAIDPAKEQDMLRHFHNTFKPAAEKFQGYIDVKIVKFHTAYQGSLPPGINYRFQLTYESEELRQKWIKSDVHKKVWPPIENMLTNKATYPVLLFDSV